MTAVDPGGESGVAQSSNTPQPAAPALIERLLRPGAEGPREVLIDVIGLVVLALLLIATGLGLRDPWPADEPRFALVAQDMLRSGDWLFPRIGGDLYADKPPFFFWLLAASMALTGSMKVGFLLPSLLAGIGTVLLVYDLVRRAIAFLTEAWWEQPELDALARHLGLSPAHCQKLFKRWCGLSPKEFLQAITIDHARRLLDRWASVLDPAHEVGLSGGGRLHDLFVDHEAMTPGDYKRRGAGLEIGYGFHRSPFGDALVMATSRGVAGVGFVNEDAGQTRAEALADMTERWPGAQFIEAPQQTAAHAHQIFDTDTWSAEQPVRLVLIGTDFEVRVWETLLKIPMGRAVSYADIARHVGKPSASRAVGSAVGRNPISFVVPCHRVLRGDGSLGGYHWGLTRKKALIGWETGRIAARQTGSAHHAVGSATSAQAST